MTKKELFLEVVYLLQDYEEDKKYDINEWYKVMVEVWKLLESDPDTYPKCNHSIDGECELSNDNRCDGSVNEMWECGYRDLYERS